MEELRRGKLKKWYILFAAGAIATGLGMALYAPKAVAPPPAPAKMASELNILTSGESATYPSHTVTATIFWIGERASVDNAHISNVQTEWDVNPIARLGGIDRPNSRTAQGLPVDFVPKEDPFYVALPASELDSHGVIAGAREASPWAGEAKKLSPDESLFKGRWVKITNSATSRTVYAQWLDTGPSSNGNAAKDYAYVFGDGSVEPSNTFGVGAGLDVSPAVAYNLGFGLSQGEATLTWQFVDAKRVAPGLWTQYPPIDNRIYEN